MPARPAAFATLLVLLGGCKKDEVVWVQFNQTGQTIVVDVLEAGAEPGEPVSLSLMSNLGRTEIGVAAVDPGSGPVGTHHLVTVDVYDAYEATVGRVTVEVRTEAVADIDDDGEKESRGEGEYELERDSADPGAWALTLQSLGVEDVPREDKFVIALWQDEDLAAEEE